MKREREREGRGRRDGGGTRSFANNYYCRMHWTGCLRDMQRAKRVAATRNDCVRIERSSLARSPLPFLSAGNEQQMLSLAVYIALYGGIPADCWFLRFSSGIYGQFLRAIVPCGFRWPFGCLFCIKGEWLYDMNDSCTLLWRGIMHSRLDSNQYRSSMGW